MNHPPTKRRRHAEFWRAARFLWPHRHIVAVSVLCALAVGLTFTGGLTMMLPILRVLMSPQDSVQDWINRQVAERRLGVKLEEDPSEVRVVRVLVGPAREAGLAAGTVVRALDPEGQMLGPSQTLGAVAGHPGGPIRLTADATAAARVVQMPEMRWYFRAASRLGQWVPRGRLQAVAAVLGVLLALTVVGNAIRFCQEYLSDKAAIQAVNDIRRKLYDHILHLPLSFFSLRGTSDVTSRLVQDAQAMHDGFKTVLGQSVQEPVKAGMAFALAMMLSWRLTLVMVVFAPLMVLVIRKFGTRMRRAARSALQESSAMLGQIESTLIGMRVVKAATAERFERRRYTQIMGQLIRQQLRMSRIDAMNTPIIETLAMVAVSAVVMLAFGLIFVWGLLDTTTFFAVMACLVAIGESLRRLSKVNNVLQRSNAAAGRIFEMLDVPTERPRRGASAPAGAAICRRLAPLQREVRFEAVTFTYPGGSAPAVLDVSLAVPKGRCVAVVGRNGSGKTTLLALLPRFYDPQQGRVLIDDVDVRSVSLTSLRRQIGIVTQDSVLFPGTIAQNIAYGLPQASRQQIIEAARRAFAHEFISELSQGYDSVVGEHGATLSGGQKQRICIARAILRQTPILILDEATSQVDAESEHLIQQAIEQLMRQRTTFVIAHRFSTILSADQIVVMDRGQIVGQGTHAELLEGCVTYQQLYERQLGGLPPAISMRQDRPSDP